MTTRRIGSILIRVLGIYFAVNLVPVLFVDSIHFVELRVVVVSDSGLPAPDAILELLSEDSTKVDQVTTADQTGEGSFALRVGGQPKRLIPPIGHFSLPFVVRTCARDGREVVTLLRQTVGDVPVGRSVVRLSVELN